MGYSFHACETDVTKATFGEGDIFQREKYADNLTKLVQKTTCPYVIALSSPWGSGKTYFLNAWKNKVAWKKDATDNEGKLACVYFSAWESENEADPLISVVAAIRQCLMDTSLLTTEKEKTLSANTIKTLLTPATIFKSSMALVKGVLSKCTGNAWDEIAAEISEKLGEGYFEKFDNWQQEKNDFSQEIKKIITDVTKETNSPTLVMIDELDRCKPDYVILLLERIKHLFQVPGLVFVLAIDKEQLHTIIKHTFGLEGVNRNVYLEKFIDIYYELPEPNIIRYARNLISLYVPITQNLDTHLTEEYTKRLHVELKQIANAYEQLYNNLNIFQQVLLGCVERFFMGKSVRRFEKKFYKFKTINDIYKPTFMQATLLFYIIISGCTVEDLFSGKRKDDGKEHEMRMHFAILSYIILNVSSDDKIFIKVLDKDFSYEINSHRQPPYTNIGILYKEITLYTHDKFENDHSLIDQYHQEGLTELRNHLQEMLDFGKNFDVV